MANKGEFAVIQAHFSQGYPHPKELQLGVGDDASVLQLEPCQLIQSIDTQVADIHFFAQAPATLIAERALRTACSDLAAMGATPLSFHLALSLPHYAQQNVWLNDFASGLKRAAKQLNIGLIGGDTTASKELVISIMVQGCIPKGHTALSRTQAQVGDELWLSGKIGLAYQALSQELIQIDPNHLSPQAHAYYRPQVHLQLGQALTQFAHSCIDVSDGLIQDAQHLAHSSNVSLILNATTLTQWLNLSADNFWHILTGGDDYQLLFSAPKQAHQVIAQLDPNLTLIGEVITQTDQAVSLSHSPCPMPETLGFQHF